MNELKWQRTQLLRIQAQQKAKQGGAKKLVPKVTQGPVKKVGPTRQVRRNCFARDQWSWDDTSSTKAANPLLPSSSSSQS